MTDHYRSLQIMLNQLVEPRRKGNGRVTRRPWLPLDDIASQLELGESLQIRKWSTGNLMNKHDME
jgi:hypothetical protein